LPVAADPRIVILCGGRGTRIARGDEDAPKPLVEVGERPILWHVMKLYADQDFNDFLLLTGWRSDDVAGAVSAFDEVAVGAWSVECVDTGEDTPTGGRVDSVRGVLEGHGTFGLTYADGVADIDLRGELEFHREQAALATMTVTRPRSPWGEARLDGERVTGFVEKPQLENWVNGGFMFLEEGALDFIGEDDVLEQRPLENLASAGELRAWRHDGFWDCMDTFKDALELNRLCAEGTPPWLVRSSSPAESAS
jgi:glucose-1-phosphate cytidylyltransferase